MPPPSPARAPRAAPGAGLHAAALFGAVALALLLGRFASARLVGARGGLLASLFLPAAVMGLLPALTDALVSRLRGRAAGPSALGLTWGESRRDAVWIAAAFGGAVALAWGLSRVPEMAATYSVDGELLRRDPLRWGLTRIGFAALGLAWETAFRGALVLRAVHLTGEREEAHATGGEEARTPHERKEAPAASGREARSPHERKEAPAASGREARTPHERKEARSAGGNGSLGGAALVVAAQTALYTVGHAGKPGVEIALSIPAGVVLALAALRTRSVLPGFLVHFALATSLNLFCL